MFYIKNETMSENLLTRDGELFYIRHFIDKQEVDLLYDSLFYELDWQQEQIFIYGKKVTVPRLVCWYGDSEASYSYSGVLHRPKDWIRGLLDLKQKIELLCENQFNSVLANLYRDENDSMGWHADKEKELGHNPFIASLSLGETRLFTLRHNKTKEVLKLELASGSLLLMGGSLQHNWQHSVPKCSHKKNARLNLTFRNIKNR